MADKTSIFEVTGGSSRLDLILALIEPIVEIDGHTHYRTANFKVKKNDLRRKEFEVYVGRAERALPLDDRDATDVWLLAGSVNLDDDQSYAVSALFNTRTRNGRLTIHWDDRL